MHNYSLLKKIVVCTLILVFSSSSFINTIKASEGVPIGKPEGTAVTEGESPVTNLKVQTIDTLLDGKCVARLTWNSPKILPKPLPDDSLYVYHYNGGTTGSYSAGSKLKINATTVDINNLICGNQYTFSIVNDRSVGKAVVTVTLAKPGSAEAKGTFVVTFNKITTTKSGTDCTATISWNQPKSQITNTRVTYILSVFPKDGTSLNYTSPSLANTVSMQKTGALTCGKDYSAQVAISLDGKPQKRIDQGFMMPTVDGANKEATKTAADPGAIKGDQDKAEITEIDNQKGEGNDTSKCTSNCPESGWIWQVDQNIAHTICQLQCAVIDWLSNMLGYVVTHILVNVME